MILMCLQKASVNSGLEYVRYHIEAFRRPVLFYHKPYYIVWVTVSSHSGGGRPSWTRYGPERPTTRDAEWHIKARELR